MQTERLAVLHASRNLHRKFLAINLQVDGSAQCSRFEWNRYFRNGFLGWRPETTPAARGLTAKHALHVNRSAPAAEELAEHVGGFVRIHLALTARPSSPLEVEVAGTTSRTLRTAAILREVEIECLPSDIPASIEADVSELVFGKVLRVSDLPHSEKLKFLTDPNQPVATVISVKEEVVATPEAVAAEAGAAPAEPEVIKKGKQEVGEEGAEPAAEKAEKPEKPEKKEKK